MGEISACSRRPPLPWRAGRFVVCWARRGFGAGLPRTTGTAWRKSGFSDERLRDSVDTPPPKIILKSQATANRRLVGTKVTTMAEEACGILSGDAVQGRTERLLECV